MVIFWRCAWLSSALIVDSIDLLSVERVKRAKANDRFSLVDICDNGFLSAMPSIPPMILLSWHREEKTMAKK